MSAHITPKIGPYVLSVNTSPGGIPKLPLSSGNVLKAGIEGDGRNHAKHVRPDRAVSLWDNELLREFAAEGFSLTPGAAGENLTVMHLNLQALTAGTMLRIGEVILKLELPRKPCYVLDPIDARLKDAVVGRFGFLASVMHEGVIRPGMPIAVISADDWRQATRHAAPASEAVGPIPDTVRLPCQNRMINSLPLSHADHQLAGPAIG